LLALAEVTHMLLFGQPIAATFQQDKWSVVNQLKGYAYNGSDGELLNMFAYFLSFFLGFFLSSFIYLLIH
jgi:hypothetical protein